MIYIIYKKKKKKRKKCETKRQVYLGQRPKQSKKNKMKKQKQWIVSSKEGLFGNFAICLWKVKKEFSTIINKKVTNDITMK